MLWFKNRHQETRDALEKKEAAVTLEVEHHKDATQKAILEAKKTTDQFNRLLRKNHITLKIHIATGGKH